MTKKIILTLAICLAEVLMTPSILAAADTVQLSNIDSDATTQTVLASEPDEMENSEDTSYATELTAVQTYLEPTSYIEIAGRTIEIYDVSSTAIDAGNHVNRYGNNFLYGHNSTVVFGSLSSLSSGNVFSVTIDGDTSDYKIAEMVTYKKIDSDSDECKQAQVCREGVEYLYQNGTIYKMESIVNGRNKYDLAIMTCAGESLGGGDATHRLVIYANQI